ncbi:hypothetical protein [Calidithermus chliarophilus]|uniref:hypothetical protein n=1 Tax=Calidithermus chliarophilus TaxID=52023 RepID=UPI0004115E0D|nr:hypothetical protein [Calidithermus chliarophilus]
MERAKKRLWRAVLRASEIVEDIDPNLALRAIHALGQVTLAYAKLHEAHDLERRLEALEQQLSEHGRIT